MGSVKRWIVRAWRWKVEVRPVENLLFYAALCALTVWLPGGALAPARSVLLVLIVMCAAVLVALFASAWRQGRKTREASKGGGVLPPRPARGDERLARLSPGHEPPEAIATIGADAARRLNEPGRKGQTQ